jgi:hypothetical protein
MYLLDEDRPDLIIRVFKIKFDALIKDLTENMVLGKVVSYTHVIEFQKRGLPHSHILLIMSPEDKPRTVNDFDKVISAELPENDTELFDIIVKHNIHGPCGNFNMNSPCMNQKKYCSKHYPKDLVNYTIQDSDGYPKYKRRDNGTRFRYGSNFIPSQWIVPYNPFLSKKYQTHINVEICSSIKAIQYLFKYIYKGPDEIEQRIDIDKNNNIDKTKVQNLSI